MPGGEKLPRILKRSSAQARRMWIKTHDYAVDEYGAGGRAHRTAFAALKHSLEEKGDRWVPKARKVGRSSKDKKELARAIARKQ